MYLMVCTRPDISYACSVVSRYLANPGKLHWDAVKWILRYLNGSAEVGLIYGADSDHGNDVIGFSDADFAKDLDHGRSIGGYVFKVFGCTISWKAALQHVVALSTTESEYIALTEAVKEVMWLKGFISELGISLNRVSVMCDSQSALQLSKNQMYHERTKHINVKFHFIRDVIESKLIDVEKVSTEENVKCLELLGVGADW